MASPDNGYQIEHHDRSLDLETLDPLRSEALTLTMDFAWVAHRMLGRRPTPRELSRLMLANAKFLLNLGREAKPIPELGIDDIYPTFLVINGHRIRFTPNEYYLVEKLAMTPGVIVSRQELETSPESGAKRYNLDNNISKIRRKLAKVSDPRIKILAERGRGYLAIKD